MTNTSILRTANNLVVSDETCKSGANQEIMLQISLGGLIIAFFISLPVFVGEEEFLTVITKLAFSRNLGSS